MKSKYITCASILCVIFLFLVLIQTSLGQNRCASFTGGDTSSISMGQYSLHTITTNLTLEAWIKPSNSIAYASIVGNIWWTSQNIGGYGMWMAGGSDPYYVGFGLADVNNIAEVNTAQLPGLNQWVHVACTYDGATMVIYVNGDTAASLAHSGEIVYDNYTDLFIGKYDDDNELYCYSGLIDEVRVWNVARTQAELRQYDSTELVGNDSGLVGYWKLNEGSGTITQDGTANDKDGTLYNVTWVGETGMPVELVSFTATAKQNNIELAWKTATEVNNFGFEVEKKSIKDELGVMKWEKIGFIEGSGTTNSPKSYSFVDKNLFPGNYFYRLKQIDRDGKFEYSNTVEVIINNTPTKYVLEQNHPNPFNPVTVISYQLPVSTHVTLRVYNAIGREIATLVNEMTEAGWHSVEFNGSALSSGIYFYTLKANHFSAIQKMLLIK